MEREEFGDWGRRLDDRAFWQAVAMLGVLGGLSLQRGTPQAPRHLREEEGEEGAVVELD